MQGGLKRIFKAAGLLAFSNGLTLLYSFGSIMVLSRAMSKEEMGVYRELMMVAQLVSIVFLLGLPSAIFYFLGRQPRLDTKLRVYRRLRRLIYLSAAASLPIVGALLFFKSPIVETAIYSKGFELLLLASVLLTIILSGYDPFFVAISENRNIVVGNTLMLVYSSAVVASYGLKLITYEAFLILAILAPLPRILWAEAKIKGHRKGGASDEPEGAASTGDADAAGRALPSYGDILRFSVPAGLASLLGTLNKYLDRIVIIAVASVDVFASYSVAAFELPVVGVLTGAIATTMLPELAAEKEKGNTEAILSYWKETGVVLACFLFPLASLSIAHAEDIVLLLFSAKYLDVVVVFAIYQLILPVRAFNFGSILYAAGKTGSVLANVLVTIVANLSLMSLGYRWLGLAGLATAAVIAVWLMAALQSLQISRVLQVRVAVALPWRELATIGVLSTLGALVSAAGRGLIGRGLGIFLLGAPAYVVLIFSFVRLRLLPNPFARKRA